MDALDRFFFPASFVLSLLEMICDRDMQGDLERELQDVSEKAYWLEQEAMRLELKVEYWQKRCADLEKEIDRLQGVQVESTCDHCSKNFMQMKKGRTARFCSASCRQLHYKGNKEFSEQLSRALG